MTSPLISLVVPVYNVAPYLQACLDSLICQTYSNLEIILVDDGSTDGSETLCDSYAIKYARIQTFHQENGGLSAARNTGIQYAYGEYITFVDSDDCLAPGFVFTLYNAIREYDADLAICATGLFSNFPKTSASSTCRLQVMTPQETIETILYQRQFDVSAWGKLYRMDLFQTRRYPVGKLFEDFATAFSLIDDCNSIVYCNSILYFYRIRSTSIMSEGFNEAKLDLLFFSSEMVRFVSERYPDLKRAAVRRDLFSHFHILRQMMVAMPRLLQREQEVVRHIRRNAPTVLFDRKAPLRDKAAICCLFFGMGFFPAVLDCFFADL